MNVLHVLSTIEKEQNIRILFACEAGSRAYGMADGNSDFDVRFVYIQPLKSYLTLGNHKETYTHVKREVDIQGWDIKKALLLAQKSNASLFEWALSPTFYVADEKFTSYYLAKIVPNLSIKVLSHHYLSLTKKNIVQFTEKKKVNFLYHAVRCALMLEMLVEQKSYSIQVKELTKNSLYFSESDYLFLKKCKEQGGVSEAFSYSFLQKINKVTETISPKLDELSTTKKSINSLEKLFHELLSVD
mgnify:CR=1 FL=1